MKKLPLILVLAAAAGCSGAGGDKTGPKPAAFTMTPSARDFSTVDVGTTSTPATFDVLSTGGAATGPLSITTAGNDAAQFTISANSCGSVSALAPGAGCSFTIAFAPIGSAGSRTAVLTVAASPGGSTAAPLTGVAVTPAALALAPTGHDFGNVPQGTMSSFNVTVSNTGGQTSGPLAFVIFNGPDGGQFTMDASACPATLAAGASCVAVVQFTPLTAGGKTGVLGLSATPGGVAVANFVGNGI